MAAPSLLRRLARTLVRIKLKGRAGLLDHGQPLDQCAKIGRGRVEGDEDQIGGGKQLGVDRAHRWGSIDEQIGSARVVEGSEPGGKIGKGEGGVKGHVDA
jgi:hypothetical protein